jgi:hypothetical protein
VHVRLSAVPKAGVLVDGGSPTDPRPMKYECCLSRRFREGGTTSMLLNNTMFLNNNLVRSLSALSRSRVPTREQ